jgi:hypothetical protein
MSSVTSTTADMQSQPSTTAPPRNLTHYGVVVGIDHYPSCPELGPLQYARRDARKFYDWLVDPQRGSVPAEQVQLICPTDEEVGAFAQNPQLISPILDRVSEALDNFAATANALKEKDTDRWERSRLWFFGAGHGIAPVDGQSALLMANVTGRTLGLHVEISKYAAWYQKHSPYLCWDPRSMAVRLMSWM